MGWQHSKFLLTLPLRTAVVYTLFFTVAFFGYSELWKDAPSMVDDSPGYLAVAQDLSNFHMTRLHERALGYPLLLLITASSQSPTRTLFFVSLFLHFASIWLLASTLYFLGLTGKILNLFGFVLVLPPYVEPAAYVLSENLAEFMLVIGFVGLVFWLLHCKMRWLVIAAVAIGYSGLIRPTYQALALAITGYLLIMLIRFRWLRHEWREIIKGVVVLMFTSAAMIGGYALLNYCKFGYFGITPKLGLTLSTKTVRVIERLPEKYAAIKDVLITTRDAELIKEDSHRGYMYMWSAVPQLTAITGLQYQQLSNYMLRINLLLIREAPLNYLHEVALAFSTYWFPSSTRLANMNSRSLQLLWAVVHCCLISTFFLTMVMLTGAVTYIIMCRRFVIRSDKALVSELRLSKLQIFFYFLAGTIVFYTALISCGIEVGDPRYRVPTDSLIAFMACLGIHVWRRLVSFSKVVFCHPQGQIS